MSSELAAALRPYAHRGTPRRYPVGALIFAEGDRSSEVLLITAGMVHVAAGRDRVVAALSQGDVVGEFAALDGRPRSAHAYAVTNVDIVALRASDALEAIEHSDLDLTSTRATSAAMRQVTERRSGAAGGLPVAQLACRLMERLDEAPGRVLDTDAGALALDLGASREQLARALEELHHRGVLALERGRVVVLDAVTLGEIGALA